MKSLKTFEEFLREGVIRKITPDINRAKALVEESKKRKDFLNQILSKIGLSDDNANYIIENAYDLLLGLLRAKLLRDGFSSQGLGAHEAEVSYMRLLGFSEEQVRLMNDLRYYRNGILYYGKSFDSEYANKIKDLLEKTYPKLIKINE